MRVRIRQAGMRLVVVGKAERGRFTPEAVLPTAWLLSIETGSAAPAAHVAASRGGAGARDGRAFAPAGRPKRYRAQAEIELAQSRADCFSRRNAGTVPSSPQRQRSSVAMPARALVLVLDGGKASERDVSSLAGDASARDAFDQLGGEIGDRVHGGSRQL